MSSKQLLRIKTVSVDVSTQLKQHGISTCKDFLTRSPLELMNILNFTYPQLQDLTTAVCNQVAPTSQTALSLYNTRKETQAGFLPTTLLKLDTSLHGGLPSSTITEIVGPPGCGKTQFCMLLSVVTSLPTSLGGKGAHVVYVDTEASFSAERLIEIARCRFPSLSTDTEQLSLVAERVHVLTELTCDGFSRTLDSLDVLIAEKDVRLVVVDSIASLARKEYDTASKRGVSERAALLSKHAARLKYLAESFEIPIVVTNQITTHMSHGHLEGEEFSIERGVVTAALGNTWSHCVNTRLLLQFMQDGKRLLVVAKSPLCGREGFVVCIEDKGLTLDWTATGVLINNTNSLEHLAVHGDPTEISLAVRSTFGEGADFPGQFP